MKMFMAVIVELVCVSRRQKPLSVENWKIPSSSPHFTPSSSFFTKSERCTLGLKSFLLFFLRS